MINDEPAITATAADELKLVSQQKFFAVSKRVPQDVKRYCGICRQHGLQMRTRSHVCAFKDCHCDKCQLILSRRNVMSEQIRLRRAQDRCFQRTSEPSEANIVPINAAQLASSTVGGRSKGDAASGPCYFCQKCKNHGILALKKQHKHECKFSDCMCPQCALIATRRNIDQNIKTPRNSQKRMNDSSSPYERLFSAPCSSSNAAPPKRSRVSISGSSMTVSSSDHSPLSSAPETPAFAPANLLLNDGASTSEWSLSQPSKSDDFTHFHFDADSTQAGNTSLFSSPSTAAVAPLLGGTELMVSTMLKNIMADAKFETTASGKTDEPVKPADNGALPQRLSSLVTTLSLIPATLLNGGAGFSETIMNAQTLNDILNTQQQRQRLNDLQKLKLKRQCEEQLRLLGEQIRQKQNNLEILKQQQQILERQQFSSQPSPAPSTGAVATNANLQHLQTIIALARQQVIFTALANTSKTSTDGVA